MSDMKNELKIQALFKGLADSEIEKVIPFVSLVRFQKDDHVFKEDEPCKGIYMIKSGKVEISKSTPDGWRQPLVILNTGHFMGEIALLEKTNHASNARTVEPSELFLIPKEYFEEMERKEPFIILKIIKNIAIIAGLNVRRMNEKFIKVLVNY
ncbi:cyclic nucleotide-binding domain-containing protein [Dissulfurispira sp.]|uniref:cyclic nucleotide-binding domain-containing protein n=1 Tax=Dissulfurispira sp. TaxID=2817609 RepID=UPI002FDA4F97